MNRRRRRRSRFGLNSVQQRCNVIEFEYVSSILKEFPDIGAKKWKNHKIVNVIVLKKVAAAFLHRRSSICDKKLEDEMRNLFYFW